MTQKTIQRTRKQVEEEATEAHTTESESDVDLAEVDALLDEIERVLEDNEEARAEFSFKDKLKAWAANQDGIGGTATTIDWAEIEIPCGCI